MRPPPRHDLLRHRKPLAPPLPHHLLRIRLAQPHMQTLLLHMHVRNLAIQDPMTRDGVQGWQVGARVDGSGGAAFGLRRRELEDGRVRGVERRDEGVGAGDDGGGEGRRALSLRHPEGGGGRAAGAETDPGDVVGDGPAEEEDGGGAEAGREGFGAEKGSCTLGSGGEKRAEIWGQ
ncbi:MAG: hypothetical protein Q9165_006229 [Trypethelium subeluteriae]